MTETRPTAETTTNVVPLQTIDELVFKAHKQFDAVVNSQQKFFAARLACGQTLLELRARIEAGEAGKVGWWEWYGTRFARSRRDAERVMELASQEDPQAAYETKTAQRRASSTPSKTQPCDPGVAKDSVEESKPPLRIVKPPPQPEPEIRQDLIDQAIDIVRQMNFATRHRFVVRLRQVYRD